MQNIRKILSKSIEKYSKFINNNYTDFFLVVGSFIFAITLPLTVIICFNPAFFRLGGTIDPLLADQFGSLLSGLLGTLVGIATTFFFIYSISIQSRANRNNQLESAFYKLVDYHKTNVYNLSIYGSKFQVTGSEVFIVLNKKFDHIYKLVESISGITDQNKLIDISYKMLFFGFENDNLGVLKEKIKTNFDQNTVEGFVTYISNCTPNISYKGNLLSVKESNEHQLGHYFRNLYNIFITIDKDDFLHKKNKKFYLKILRTQLSTPEAWLLFLNSISEMGENWKRQDFITKYQVIKNIPKNYCEYIDFEKYYPTIKYEYKDNL